MERRYSKWEKKKIYLLFTDTGTLFTKLIKLYTKKRYNHVSISFEQPLSEIYSFGRKKCTNPFIGGFVREKIAAGLFKKAKCKIYSYTISELEYQKILLKVKQFEAEKELYKYNLLGLFAIIINYNLTRKKAFFCSQFVATVLNEKSGLLNKSPNLCTPQDLMDLKFLELVYEGPLDAYPYQEKNESIKSNLEVITWKPKLRYSPDFN